MAQSRHRGIPLTCLLLVVLFLILAGGAYWAALSVQEMARSAFGEPSPQLSAIQRVQYSAQLILNQEALLTPVNSGGVSLPFEVKVGESVNSVGLRLEQAGLINSAEAFRYYLIYSGLDTNLQAGKYELSPAWNSLEIAARLQDATPAEVLFVILPGWRAEEIAAALPTSGLSISAMDFMAAVRNPKPEWLATLGISASSLEGFLFPGEYRLPRETDLDGLISVLIASFNDHVTPEIRSGFEEQGLDLLQAVTLASIVQREAVIEDEAPMIASVFFNRLAAGSKLDSDPTVQYALGYNAEQKTWWTNPLSLTDLEIRSAYNTYQNAGLPPGPICNPGLIALQSVARPAVSPYYYFQARCDGSGYHNFATTFEEHIRNSCE
jgi:UPF0755 protein